MIKKTLSIKLKNTLRNAPLVPDSVSSALNKVERLSVQNKVLVDNSPEVDPLQHTGGQNSRVFDIMCVFVLNRNNKPLMPTNPRKARLLLKTGRVVVVKRFPFTIKLTGPCGENRQKVFCGVDSGFSHIGTSCITNSKELIAGIVELDNKTSKRLIEKRMYRRLKRNKLRYREPRFNNRKRKDNWIPPSIERKYQTHLNLIKRLKQLISINDIKIEVGNFDIQKLNNPDISGIEYQQGNLYNYNNLKSFILSREKGICQLCNKEYIQNNPWRLHHIIQKSKGGTNRPDNLALLHEKCHIRLHKNNLKLKPNKQYKQYKESTFMNIIKNRFQKDLDCKLVFGYETKTKRNELNLEKSHINDAFIIAGGTTQIRSFKYIIKQKRKNNRSLQLNREGFEPSIRKQRYKLQPKDLVKIDNEIFEVVGTHNKGKNVIIRKNNKNISFSIKKVDWYFNNKTLIFKQEGISSVG